MNKNPSYIKNLKLPGRFEKLKEFSQDAGCDLSSVIQRVEEACSEVETLIREVDTSGLGRLLILHGPSGSGKTTFLKGLTYFFENIDVIEIPKTIPIVSVADWIDNDSIHRSPHRLYIVHDRDNPNESESDLRECFEALRSFFRTSKGEILVVWPITKRESADQIAEIAWDIGRDSLLGTRDKVYDFVGLQQEAFFDVADITTRALNNGESLEAFGIARTTAESLIRESDTIGEFYLRLNGYSASRNSQALQFLKERVRPRVWVVLPGDDLKELDRTISNLTQGTRNRIDIDKISEFLDDQDNDAAYLNDWRNRRADMAYLMRILDVRLFELPPNASLAAVRCYGAPEITKNLRKKSESPEACNDILSKTRLGQALAEPDATCSVRIRDTSDEMAREYMAIQQLAAKGDTLLNKAVGSAIEKYFANQGQEIAVLSEKKQLPGSQLKPDIQIPLGDSTIACLELTWRSTGKLLPERDGRKAQNTLTPGHIIKYLLAKVMEYVKDLKL